MSGFYYSTYTLQRGSVAMKMNQQITPIIDYPSAYSNWLRVLLYSINTKKELTICGENALKEMNALNANYLPNIILGGSNKPSNLPFLQNRFQEKATLFYACENKSCQIPTTDCSKITTNFFS
jgi:uncharacterized protein YyaL (SSP411 family)